MTQYNIVPSGASISDVTDKFKKSPHFFHVVMLDSADALCGVKSKHLCFDITQYGTEDDLDCPVCRRKLAKLTGSEGAKGTKCKS
jgi:hypothetical protein